MNLVYCVMLCRVAGTSYDLQSVHTTIEGAHASARRLRDHLVDDRHGDGPDHGTYWVQFNDRFWALKCGIVDREIAAIFMKIAPVALGEVRQADPDEPTREAWATRLGGPIKVWEPNY